MTASRTEATAVLFDIQRLALDDGPGIRTNVFFKGCPLRCTWCHNPESYSMDVQLAYNAQLCVGCGMCAEVCEYGVHEFVSLKDSIVHRVSHEKCTGCGACLEVCCYDALALAGKSYTVSELIEAVLVDRPYYSIGDGGGVTLTGGEPMLQWEFVDEFLDRMGEVHVAVETSGHAPAEAFDRVAPKVDLFLFDIKASAEKHNRLCGVENGLIMDNLERICSTGARVILRLPLIPTVNDDDAHLKAVADILRRHPAISYAQIMPYHNLGESKRERFGMPPQADGIPDAGDTQKAKWLSRFAHFGAENVRCA